MREGAGRETVKRVFASNTTNEAIGIVRREGFSAVWGMLAERTACRCSERVCGKLKVGAVFIDAEGGVLGSA